MKLYTESELHFGFTGFALDGEKAPEVLESPCLHPEGHLWQQAPYQLLSNPPQNVYSCVREGCGAVRHVLQRRPQRKLIPDSQLPKG